MYIDLVMLLNFSVDWLLIMGTNRLCGFVGSWKRPCFAATIGGIYGGLCLLPQMAFLGNFFFRVLSLLIMGGVAFGFNISALRRCVVFAVLTMSLGGIAMVMRSNGPFALLAATAVLMLLCKVGLRRGVGRKIIVPVELNFLGKQIHLMALEDTGNNLKDPVTGRSVLIVGSQIAKQLLGVSQSQLRKPVEAVVSLGIPGLRLIPYSSIGESGRFLLAMRIKNVKIGSWQGSSLVAFSPEYMGLEGYQGLTGGNV